MLTTTNFSSHIRQLEYLATIQSFDDGAPSRDLVHLVHQDRCDVAGLLTPYVSSLVYENVADIPRLVTRSQDICDLFAGLGPCTVEAECTEDTGDDIDGLQLSPADSQQDHAPRRDWSNPTEQEVASACRIQMAYRLYRIRHTRGTFQSNQWKTDVNKYFLECLSKVLFWGWKRDSYRRIYLNKLPVLLVCLDRGMNIVYAIKRKARIRMLNSSGERLEGAKGCVNRST